MASNTYIAIHDCKDGTWDDYQLPHNPDYPALKPTWVTKLFLNQEDGSQLEISIFSNEVEK